MTTQKHGVKRKVALCILDGWGISSSSYGDATRVAAYFKKLWSTYPHTLLQASGSAVGLPDGQMGNSEVGHTTIGLGRIIKQDLLRINDAMLDGTLAQKLQTFAAKIRAKGGAAHVLGLASPGGVHSHIDHMQSVINIIALEGVNVYVHVILDGRDTQSCSDSVLAFQSKLPSNTKIVSACGRFWAMDRDHRWERTEDAYRLIAEQQGKMHAPSCEDMFKTVRPTSDEFVLPFTIGDAYSESLDNGLVFINFRADRARQITRALTDPSFDEFERKNFPRFSSVLTMTEYDKSFEPFCKSLISKDWVESSLGQVLSNRQMRQFRIAESEKYAHVTYFLNGGIEEPMSGEHRVLIPSPNVQTYDETPAMSAEVVTQEVIAAFQYDYDLIVVNYANADMLGHTGNLQATEQSILVVDECLARLVDSAKQHGYTLFITADHGNAEQMLNADGSPQNMHTTNLVPFLVLDEDVHLSDSDGELANIAPTILQYLGISPPVEMASSLLQHASSKKDVP
ncbi:MAG: 2,3-bisphosphoglycerate-independent phosphoglycerate mutase [Holosporales bacterium]|jgi:2,3-bisphosphoglycerate-independent phosphoglycerate mutase|nr:2,3-bisphosphoglycerate-independent phosphoglycerate mutase [Holosporales bacterium]